MKRFEARILGGYWILWEGMKMKYGREEGIRTLEGLHPTRVPVVRLRPLGHLSTVSKTSPQMAAAHEKEGWAATFLS